MAGFIYIRFVEGAGGYALEIEREFADRIEPERERAVLEIRGLERLGGEGEVSVRLAARAVEQRHVEERQVQEIAVIGQRPVTGFVEAAGCVPGEFGGQQYGHSISVYANASCSKAG